MVELSCIFPAVLRLLSHGSQAEIEMQMYHPIPFVSSLKNGGSAMTKGTTSASVIAAVPLVKLYPLGSEISLATWSLSIL